MSFSLLLPLVAGLSLTQVDEPIVILQRAADLAADPSSLRFEGEREVTVLEQGQARVHRERVLRSGRSLRIDFPPGSRFGGQTIIEQNGIRRQYLADRREIRLLSTKGEESGRLLAFDLRAVQSGRLQLAAFEGGEIAGRPTVRLTLSRRGGRVVTELSVEPTTGFVLRRVVFSPKGEPIGTFVYTRIRLLESVSAKRFVYATDARWRTIQPVEDLRRLSNELGVAFAFLPPSSGYRLEGVRSRQLPFGKVLASVYVAKGRRLTLFASTATLPELPESGKRMGMGNVHLTIWKRGTTNFGLVGEESPERLTALISQISYESAILLPSLSLP